MTTRNNIPNGAPCWTDLWTSDVEGSRRFYGELFGWEAGDASPEFGGYFMFFRNGVPVAGAMGDMPHNPAQNVWKIYLATDDIDGTVKRAEAEGAQVVVPPMAVADLGTQAVLIDPTGAVVGAWQPGTFPGNTVLEEPGTPSWFELHTRHHARAVAFYSSVFGWATEAAGDTDEFRYTLVRHPSDQGELAGVMDASSFLPEGVASNWKVYWAVEDVDGTLRKACALGGSVVDEAVDTPYGRLASLSDPAGATFKLRRPPA